MTEDGWRILRPSTSATPPVSRYGSCPARGRQIEDLDAFVLVGEVVRHQVHQHGGRLLAPNRNSKWLSSTSEPPAGMPCRTKAMSAATTRRLYCSGTLPICCAGRSLSSAAVRFRLQLFHPGHQYLGMMLVDRRQEMAELQHGRIHLGRPGRRQRTRPARRWIAPGFMAPLGACALFRCPWRER